MFDCATGFRNHRRWDLVIGFGCLANAIFYSIARDAILDSKHRKVFCCGNHRNADEYR